MRRLAISAAVAAVLALAGCTTSHVDNPAVSAPPSVPFTGTAGATGGSGALADPCTLADPAEIQVSFGGVVSPGAKPAGAVRAECDWTVTGSNMFGDGKLVAYYPSVQSSAAFHAAKAGLPGAQDLPGLGNPAFYQPDTGALTMLVGEHQFVMQADFPAALHGKDAITLETGLIGIATVAANRL